MIEEFKNEEGAGTETPEDAPETPEEGGSTSGAKEGEEGETPETPEAPADGQDTPAEGDQGEDQSYIRVKTLEILVIKESDREECLHAERYPGSAEGRRCHPA